jgi:hypothetical protein
MILTITGEKTMPRAVTMVRMKIMTVRTICANSMACCLDFFCRYSVNTGIKATENEPSAKSLLKRFGIRNATKNASAEKPLPKKLAISISLTKPRTLLRKVKAPTVPAALVTSSFSLIKNLDRIR